MKSFFLKSLGAVFMAAAIGMVGVVGYGLSDRESAEKILADDERFTIQEYKGHAITGCGRDGMWRDEFKVIRNKTGEEKNVVVCQSLFDGGVVRIR